MKRAVVGGTVKSPTVYFQRIAAEEYRAARDWYAERSRQAAERFRQAVSLAVDRIADRPNAHPIMAQSYRQVRVFSLPLLVNLPASL